MCEPVSTSTAIMLAATAASTALTAIGSIQSGQAQKKMAEYNALIAEDSARYQAARQQDKVRRLMASARVAINKSGLAMSGSPLDVLADSATQAELDHQAILRNGAAQAGMDRYRGRVAQQAGYFGAATSLLKGAGSVMGAFGSIGPATGADAPSAYGLGDGVTYSLGNAGTLDNYDWTGFRLGSS